MVLSLLYGQPQRGDGPQPIMPPVFRTDLTDPIIRAEYFRQAVDELIEEGQLRRLISEPWLIDEPGAVSCLTILAREQQTADRVARRMEQLARIKLRLWSGLVPDNELNKFTYQISPADTE